jgi:hypothetical protein
MNPQFLQQQQALLARQQRQQQLMNGMGVNNPGMAAFQNPAGGAPQMRVAGGLPNGMYAGGGPGGVPTGNMGAFAAGNPQLRGMFPPHVQQQLQQQQHQQQQIAAAQQYTMATQAAAQANPQASAMNIPQQGQQMPMTASLQAQQQALAAQAQQRVAAVNAAQYVQPPPVTQRYPTLADDISGITRKPLGLSVLRLHQFADHLAGFHPNVQNNDINHWHRFVGEFYSPIGVMRQRLAHNSKNETKQFEITTNLLARYYFTLFESGIRTVQMILEQPREKPTVNQGMIVECLKTSFIYWFENDCHVSCCNLTDPSMCAELRPSSLCKAHYEFTSIRNSGLITWTLRHSIIPNMSQGSR